MRSEVPSGYPRRRTSYLENEVLSLPEAGYKRKSLTQLVRLFFLPHHNCRKSNQKHRIMRGVCDTAVCVASRLADRGSSRSDCKEKPIGVAKFTRKYTLLYLVLL